MALDRMTTLTKRGSVSLAALSSRELLVIHDRHLSEVRIELRGVKFRVSPGLSHWRFALIAKVNCDSETTGLTVINGCKGIPAPELRH